MDKKTWDKWLVDWNFIIEIAKNRNWDYSPLIIKPTISIKDINQLENELQIKYPVEFKNILTDFSAGVRFSWQMKNEEAKEEFRSVFCGCGEGYLWDFEN